MENLNSYLKAPDVLESKIVLCIAPHPDDIEISMGALVKKFHKQGTKIIYLTVTDGSLGTQNETISEKEVVEIRKAELEASATYLGVDELLYLNHKDGTLNDALSLAGEISEIIRQVKPDTIFAPDPYNDYEAHLDHIVTGKAASYAFINSGLAHFPRNTKTKPWSAKIMAYYFTSKPNQFIDIKAEFDNQFNAMKLHESQLDETMLNMYRTYFEAVYSQYGMAVGKELCLPIKVLSPLHMHCFTQVDLIK